jgi:hypothetical protein
MKCSGENVKVRNLIWKEKFGRLYVHKTVQKEKDIRVSFAVTPQTAKIMATTCKMCLVKMEIGSVLRGSWNISSKHKGEKTIIQNL